MAPTNCRYAFCRQGEDKSAHLCDHSTPIMRLVLVLYFFVLFRCIRETAVICLQGPTSSGKTSLVTFLAAQTGHEFVRINNHQGTDLQVKNICRLIHQPGWLWRLRWPHAHATGAAHCMLNNVHRLKLLQSCHALDKEPKCGNHIFCLLVCPKHPNTFDRVPLTACRSRC